MESDLIRLQGLRSALASHLSRLSPEKRSTRELATFLEKWPENKLEEGLMGALSERKQLDANLRTLSRAFPVNGWRTLFPLFRP